MSGRLTIQPLAEYQGRPFGWWSKGHHRREEFDHALWETHRERLQEEDDFYQETWRFIPPPGGDSPGYFDTATPGKRGAFPVTVVYRARRP